MAQGIQPGELQNAREVYADIIDLPHWNPKKSHPRMTLYNRAAQFAPFAALTGYDEMIYEEARMTDRQIELAESQEDLLNQQLNAINADIASGIKPEVTITYFIPDPRKAGGKYSTITAQVKRIEPTELKMVLVTKNQPNIPETIRFDQILSIQGEAVDYLADD